MLLSLAYRCGSQGLSTLLRITESMNNEQLTHILESRHELPSFVIAGLYCWLTAAGCEIIRCPEAHLSER